jgi:hypothetical protein
VTNSLGLFLSLSLGNLVLDAFSKNKREVLELNKRGCAIYNLASLGVMIFFLIANFFKGFLPAYGKK